MTPVSLWVAVGLTATLPQPSAQPAAPPSVRVAQPVHEYFTPFGPAAGPLDRGTYATEFTHLGTDFGPIGPDPGLLAWEPGGWVRADARGEWVGTWHSLAGLARESNATLDFRRCYPAAVEDEFQPACRGITLRAKGTGRVRLEIKGPDQRVLWRQGVIFSGPARDLTFDCDPAGLRQAKFLNWVAEPGSAVSVDAVGLVVEFPPMPFPDRVFLTAYAKLARCAVPGAGLVRDQAQRPAGAFEGVPASGLYALATAAAADRGIVGHDFAVRTFREVHRAVAALPRADGWLPHFVSRGRDGRYTIHPGTEYSTIDTSLTYHALLLAARLLGDPGAEAELLAEVRALRFDRLRDPDGYLRMGYQGDGRTVLSGSWRPWGGEAALVALLERMALGPAARPKMDRSGRFPDGVGFVAEVQSLFYPQFDADRPDAFTGINWLAARRNLIRDQVLVVAHTPKAQPAARLGLFGLSAGEGFRGRSYVADGTRTGTAEVLHPHYLLMAGQALPRPDETYARLRLLEGLGLMPPWGLVENVAADLSEYLPVQGSLNAAFECLAAYHLAARSAGRPDRVYDAARSPGPMADAVQLFYPPGRPD